MTTPVSTLAHSHAETWNLRPDLDQASSDFGRAVLPIVRELKIRLIGVGGLVLGAPDPNSADLAASLRDLSDRIPSWVTLANSCPPTDFSRQFVAGLMELQEWSAVASTQGVSATVAAGMAGAYRRVRAASDTAWHSELVPEGRTPSTGKERSDD